MATLPRLLEPPHIKSTNLENWIFSKYSFYRGQDNTWVLARDKINRRFALLSIRRNSAALEINGGDVLFTELEIKRRLRQIETDEGALVHIDDGYGVLGFFSLLQGNYAIIVTKRKKAARLFGYHSIYSIEKFRTVALFEEDFKNGHLQKDEGRLLDLFSILNFSKDFYFSYSYNISRSVQQNYIQEAAATFELDLKTEHDYGNYCRDGRFTWNILHTQPLFERGLFRWILPIIHGFIGTARCSCSGRVLECILIARRSRFFAGTRYRKRGVDANGSVANDVETEQILCDSSASNCVSSFLQCRGSVPIFWAQETKAILPKPPVVYHCNDTHFSTTRAHFKDLLFRYGPPVVAMNLMLANDPTSDEPELGAHFEEAIESLNREVPCSVKIQYESVDLKHKHRVQPKTFPTVLESLSQRIISRLGYFFAPSRLNGKPIQRPIRTQSGVLRTNCVDCLDRTNAAQFFFGSAMLAHQLHALGFIGEPSLNFDSQLVSVLSELYNLLGDHLSLQYGGSVAHKTYTQDRPRIMRHSKELLTSITRHYSNSFAAPEKQHATNLFLGILQPKMHPRPWLVDADSWLHHRPFRDNYMPSEWWVLPLQYHHHHHRVLALLPQSIFNTFQPSTHLLPDTSLLFQSAFLLDFYSSVPKVAGRGKERSCTISEGESEKPLNLDPMTSTYLPWVIRAAAAQFIEDLSSPKQARDSSIERKTESTRRSLKSKGFTHKHILNTKPSIMEQNSNAGANPQQDETDSGECATTRWRMNHKTDKLTSLDNVRPATMGEEQIRFTGIKTSTKSEGLTNLSHHAFRIAERQRNTVKPLLLPHLSRATSVNLGTGSNYEKFLAKAFVNKLLTSGGQKSLVGRECPEAAPYTSQIKDSGVHLTEESLDGLATVDEASITLENEPTASELLCEMLRRLWLESFWIAENSFASNTGVPEDPAGHSSCFENREKGSKQLASAYNAQHGDASGHSSSASCVKHPGQLPTCAQVSAAIRQGQSREKGWHVLIETSGRKVKPKIAWLGSRPSESHHPLNRSISFGDYAEIVHLPFGVPAFPSEATHTPAMPEFELASYSRH